MRKYIIRLLIRLILPGCHLSKNPPKGRRSITPAKLAQQISSGEIQAKDIQIEGGTP